MNPFEREGASPHELLRYLRDCYQAHGSGGELLDLFHRKIDHRHVVDGPETVLHEARTIEPVDRATFQATAEAADLYQRERSLLYAVLPIAGRVTDPTADGAAKSSSLRLCAPLVSFPATLEQDDDFPPSLLPLAVDFTEPSVNLRALTVLLGEEGRAGEVADALLSVLPEPPWTAARLASFLAAVTAEIPELNVSSCDGFPELLDETALRKMVRAASRKGARPPLLPAAAVVLAPQSYATRGILHELGVLSEEADGAELSPPLLALLGAAHDVPEPPEIDTVALPAVLSTPQTRALVAARSHTVSQVIGPPGTGKSFTLAAVALEHVSRGEPVLVAARTDTALDVVAGKIEELYGDRGILVRAGRKQYLSELKEQLEMLLARGPAGVDPKRLRSKEKRLTKVDARLRQAAERLARRAELEMNWGAGHHPDGAPGWGLGALSEAVAQGWRTARLRRKAPYGAVLGRYEALLEERVRLAREVLRLRTEEKVDRTLTRHRTELKEFLRGLRARQSGRQAEIFSQVDLAVVLHALPLWLVSFSDVHRVLPLVPESFSLVVIDEATQCDPGSGLPVVERGQRVLVSGDPRQLRHVSFLARSRQRAMAERRGLSPDQARRFDYRGTSLLDLAGEAIDEAGASVLLDEHFRSTPRLIGFSNREMYRGALKVMTRRPETEETRSLVLRRVDGCRLPEGHNPQEARALVDELSALVEAEAALPSARCRTIGVLSPFRDQVEHLDEEIRRRLRPAELARHSVTVGTPYAFQGEERDVMLLSLALDGSSHSAAFRYLDRPDVFNVAITRARSLQVVFSSLSGEALAAKVPPESLLGRYLAYLDAGSPGAAVPAVSSSSDGSRDAFVRAVGSALEAKGCRIWEAYRVAGFPVDLVVERGGASLGVDLVGSPGAYADVLDLERYRMLRRAGLPLVPVTWFAWLEDPAGVVAEIELELEARRSPSL